MLRRRRRSSSGSDQPPPAPAATQSLFYIQRPTKKKRRWCPAGGWWCVDGQQQQMMTTAAVAVRTAVCYWRCGTQQRITPPYGTAPSARCRAVVMTHGGAGSCWRKMRPVGARYRRCCLLIRIDEPSAVSCQGTQLATCALIPSDPQRQHLTMTGTPSLQPGPPPQPRRRPPRAARASATPQRRASAC